MILRPPCFSSPSGVLVRFMDPTNAERCTIQTLHPAASYSLSTLMKNVNDRTHSLTYSVARSKSCMAGTQRLPLTGRLVDSSKNQKETQRQREGRKQNEGNHINRPTLHRSRGAACRYTTTTERKTSRRINKKHPRSSLATSLQSC